MRIRIFGDKLSFQVFLINANLQQSGGKMCSVSKIFIAIAAALTLTAYNTLLSAQEGIIIEGMAKTSNPTAVFKGVKGNDATASAINRDLLGCGWFDMIKNGKADYIIEGQANGGFINITVSNGAGVEIKKFSVPENDPADTAHLLTDSILKELFNVSKLCRAKLVFAAQTDTVKREILISDFDGNRRKQITSNGTLSIEPQWTPDGKSIIYSHYGQGYTCLAQYNLTLGKFRKLTSYKGINAGGAVSPDGKYIALILNRDNKVDLYMRELEGSKLKRLTDNISVEASPVWSPDGKTICFVSDLTGRPQLYTVAPFDAAPTPRRISAGTGSERVAPDWSGDGKIVYSGKTGGSYIIRILDMSKGAPREVPLGAGVEIAGEDPSWSPDNRHVVFARGGAIYLLDTFLGRERCIMRGKSRLFSPSYSN